MAHVSKSNKKYLLFAVFLKGKMGQDQKNKETTCHLMGQSLQGAIQAMLHKGTQDSSKVSG